MSKYKVLGFCGITLLVLGIAWIIFRLTWVIPLLQEYSYNKMAIGEILIGNLAAPITISIVPGSIMIFFGMKNRTAALNTCPNCENKVELSWNVCIHCAFHLKD